MILFPKLTRLYRLLLGACSEMVRECLEAEQLAEDVCIILPNISVGEIKVSQDSLPWRTFYYIYPSLRLTQPIGVRMTGQQPPPLMALHSPEKLG